MKKNKNLKDFKSISTKEQCNIKGGIGETPYKCFPGMTCPPGTTCVNYTCVLFAEE
jgi:hypothetical protein